LPTPEKGGKEEGCWFLMEGGFSLFSSFHGERKRGKKKGLGKICKKKKRKEREPGKEFFC